MEAVVKKWGNSLGIRIPSPIANDLRLEDGTEIEIIEEPGRMVIRRRMSFDLSELLGKIRPENLHAETDTRAAVGKESW